MGSTANLEERVAILERELALIRSRVDQTGSGKPWWERIAGTFQNDPVYEEARQLGLQYRRSQGPDASSD